MTLQFDLIIIGSGAGLNIAGPLAALGQTVAIIEQGPLGGTCLNRGCIPSKMLIHSADVVETIRSAHLFGIKVQGYEVDFPSIVKRVTELVDGDSKEIEESFRGSKNPLLFKGECRFIANRTIRVGSETVTSKKILIATGGRPAIPTVPGLEGSGFITSDEALRLNKQPKVLNILGGGYIAVEMAHFFGSLGTRVNIIEKHDTLVYREDEEISQKFTEIMRTKHNVLTERETVKVARNGEVFEVTVRDAHAKSSTVLSDLLLVATGRRPNSDGLDLEETGVKTDQRGFIITDEYLETNVKGIFALGDVLGHFLFRHSANLESEYDYYNMMDPQSKIPVDYTAMPHAIFSSPQVAGVGRTEQELRAEKSDYLVGRHAYIDTAMGKAIDDRSGFVKILADKKTKKILGCHIMGSDASTLIHEVIVAMKSGDGSVGNITTAIHVHPAMSEVIQRAAGNLQ